MLLYKLISPFQDPWRLIHLLEVTLVSIRIRLLFVMIKNQGSHGHCLRELGTFAYMNVFVHLMFLKCSESLPFPSPEGGHQDAMRPDRARHGLRPPGNLALEDRSCILLVFVALAPLHGKRLPVRVLVSAWLRCSLHAEKQR